MIVGLVLGPVAPRSAWAWGDNGHIAVAKVADAMLSSQARKKIDELLSHKPIYARSVCMFADTFKHKAAGGTRSPGISSISRTTSPGTTRPGTARGRIASSPRSSSNPKSSRMSSSPRRSGSWPCKLLIHFVGDIHQPLHCADRFDDHGGNAVSVRFLEGVGISNLHAVWDSDILDENMQELDPEEYADQIRPKITPASRTKWEAATDPVIWANEGHDLAKKFVYEGVPIPGGPPFRLNTAYVDRAKPVVETQIQKAGVRLAKLLNNVFELTRRWRRRPYLASPSLPHNARSPQRGVAGNNVCPGHPAVRG